MNWYAHQQQFLTANPKKHLMCWDTGTGKSFASLGLCQQNLEPPLVVCPKSLKEKWERDIETMGMRGDVMSKEEFRRDWDTLRRSNAIIFDEGHYFSGMTSQMHKAALKYIQKHKPDIVLVATATPYLSTPWNIYAIAKLLGHHWSYGQFKDKFFDERFLYSRTIPVVKPGMEKQIAALVNSIGSTVRLNECVDVPDQSFENEVFKLTAAQKKAKDEVKKMETNPVVKFAKYHQIDNGSLKGNEYVEDQFVKYDKFDRIIDLCEGNPKIAIVCRYNLQIDFLEAELMARKYSVFVIRGKVKNRDGVVAAVENAKASVVLIQASCSEGYELPSIGVIVFASLSFSYKDYKQMLGRFLRINALKKNVFIHLITEESVDQAVFDSVMRKQDFSVVIYAREMGEVVSSEDEQAGSGLPNEI